MTIAEQIARLVCGLGLREDVLRILADEDYPVSEILAPGKECERSWGEKNGVPVSWAHIGTVRGGDYGSSTATGVVTWEAIRANTKPQRQRKSCGPQRQQGGQSVSHSSSTSDTSEKKGTDQEALKPPSTE